MIEIILWTAAIGIVLLITSATLVSYVIYKMGFDEEEYEYESGYLDDTKDYK